jgi:hypothetical protein
VSPERFHEARISLQPFSLSFSLPSFSRFYCLCESHGSTWKDNHGVIIASPNVCKRISRRVEKNKNNKTPADVLKDQPRTTRPYRACGASITTNINPVVEFFYYDESKACLFFSLSLVVCMPPNHIVLPMPWPNNRYRDFFNHRLGWLVIGGKMEIIWPCNQPIKERKKKKKKKLCDIALPFVTWLLGMILFLGRWHAHLLYLRERLWVSAKQVDTTLFFLFGQAGVGLQIPFFVLSLVITAVIVVVPKWW